MTTDEKSERQLIECPCCHGERMLLVYDDAWPDDPPQKMACCHCSSTGVVALDGLSVYDHEIH